MHRFALRTPLAAPPAHFRDGSQRARACQALLGLVGTSERWTPAGPAPEARVAPTGDADPDAQRILEACWALWEGSSTLTMNELLRIGPSRLEAVGELLSAMGLGPAAIDAWFARWEPHGVPPRTSSRSPRAVGRELTDAERGAHPLP